MFPAFDGVVLAGSFGRAVEALPGGAVENVEHQRGLAGAGDPRNGAQGAQGYPDGNILQIVLACPADDEAFPAAGPPPGAWHGGSTRKVIARDGRLTSRDLAGRSLRDDVPPVLARAGADVYHVVRG